MPNTRQIVGFALGLHVNITREQLLDELEYLPKKKFSVLAGFNDVVAFTKSSLQQLMINRKTAKDISQKNIFCIILSYLHSSEVLLANSRIKRRLIITVADVKNHFLVRAGKFRS